MLAGAKDDRRKGARGRSILMTGLLLQLLAFGFFTAITIRFHLKLRRLRSVPGLMEDRRHEWRALLFCLYASCILIMIRM